MGMGNPILSLPVSELALARNSAVQSDSDMNPKVIIASTSASTKTMFLHISMPVGIISFNSLGPIISVLQRAWCTVRPFPSFCAAASCLDVVSCLTFGFANPLTLSRPVL
uniref:Uncharacterized protein n=1 Tax=Eutreptiella gymnastica TaxID=73025 RepID=A0A7S4C7J3_9EUGL